MARKDFLNEDAVDGESKINIAFKFELHLLDIIEKYNDYIRSNDPFNASLELQFLFEEIIDKIDPDDIRKHEACQMRATQLRRWATYWSYKRTRQAGGVTVLTNEAKKKLGIIRSQLLELCSGWKKQLILTMNKHGMLVTRHKGAGEAITN